MLEQLYVQFLAALAADPDISAAAWKVYAGHRFLYVTTPLREPTVTARLTERGASLTQGTRVQPECIYVRSDGAVHVYRFRFTVPNEKRFCCGNLCPDCLRLRQS